MDYRALTTLREALETYTYAVKTAPNKPDTPAVPAVLQQAASRLPPKEVIRELGALPHNITRLFVVRNVCEPIALRHAALQSSLLSAPKYKKPRNKRTWYKTLELLVDSWQVLESENGDQRTISSLRQLRKRVEEVLPHSVGNSLPLATLLVTSDARLQKVERLQHRINDAVALLEKGHLAHAHDGLQEVVQSLWAQIRSEYPALSRLTKEGVEGPESEVVIRRIENTMAELRARYTALICMGFEIPGLEVARGEGRKHVSQEDEDEDEDEWEDAWEEPVKFDDLADDNVDEHDTERATDKPTTVSDGIENFLRGNVGGNSLREEIVLPPVKDWVAVMKGTEGDKMNRLLLDQMEAKAALETNGQVATNGIRDVVSRGRGKDRSGGSRSGKKAGTTVRQRLSAALGIKKRKKKSLLD